jgi:hypothetical protein
MDGVAVGGAGGQNFALGGSVALTYTNTRNFASNTGGAISTPGSVKIAADTAVQFITVAGALAIVAGKSQGVAAIGIANATLISNDETEAAVPFRCPPRYPETSGRCHLTVCQSAPS